MDQGTYADMRVHGLIHTPLSRRCYVSSLQRVVAAVFRRCDDTSRRCHEQSLLCQVAAAIIADAPKMSVRLIAGVSDRGSQRPLHTTRVHTPKRENGHER